MMTFEIIEDLDKVSAYQEQWDQLYDSGAYEASLSLEWTQALLKTHLESDKFLLIIIRDSTELLGIVPLCIRKTRKYGLPKLTLFPTSEYFNTHSDMLLRNSSDELIEVLLKALISLKSRWDVFSMGRFIESSPILERIAYALKNNFSLKYEIRRTEPSFFIPIGDSYDNYLAGRSANFRYKLKKISKVMQSAGNIVFVNNEDIHDFGEAYAVILSIEERSWKHKNGTAMTSSRKSREFYRVLCQHAFDKGRLRLCVLYLNREPAAFEMGLLKDKKYYSVHGSYDEKFKKENPGHMLLQRFIEDLIRIGIRELDWFGEPFEFQRHWTDDFRWHKSLLIYNNTPLSRLYYIYNILRNKPENNEDNQFVLRNPRDIKPE